jgi:hypothetical protein
MASLQEKLLELTQLEPEAGDTSETYTQRVLEKVIKIPDAKWSKLDPEIQTWANINVTKLDDGEKLTQLLDVPETANISSPESRETDSGVPASDEAMEEDMVANGHNGAAKKAKKAAGPKGRRGRRPAWDGDWVITVVTPAPHPHRAGTKNATNLAKYKTKMTVDQVLATGVPRPNIRYEKTLGNIRVSRP